MAKSTLLVLILFLSRLSLAEADLETIKIGLLSDRSIQAIQIHPEQGIYNLIADGKNLGEFGDGNRVSFIQYGSLVRIKTPEKELGSFKFVQLIGAKDDSFFRLYSIKPSGVERVYDDDLLIESKSGNLKLINQVALENYVAGVVEAETGKGKPIEFYKAQSVISRSYALNNLRRYLRYGYNLNDLVDCQVYHGKARWEPKIKLAVQMTEGKVLVDSEMELITAAFHSNSGGETVSSEAVWSGSLSYLTKREDRFSLNGEHARWEKTIYKAEWLEYLEKKFSLDINDRLIREMATNYEQLNREVYFLDPSFNIPLKDIRKDWKFNSTYFNISPQGSDSLLVKGKGFGHGTGLSQEGAMRMADLGFSYSDILHFYYDDVHIIDLEAIEFFRVE